jgi:hypothetical protein
MTKISLNTEEGEIQVTRNIGKSGDGKVTINREGGGAIEINLGVGSFGLTSDYGGAISLGVGGQEVTWGREGGTIHIGIGGFNVDVEARDCIVTEIKSIYGNIVAQRSYPDPGCKLPDPPTPTPRPTPTPAPTPGGIEVPNSTDLYWAVSTTTARFLDGYNYHLVPTISEETKPVDQYILPFTVEKRDKFGTRHRAKKGSRAYYQFVRFYYDDRYHEYYSMLMSTEYYSEFFEQWLAPHQREELALFGTGVEINNYLNDQEARNRWDNAPSYSFPRVTRNVIALIPLIPPELPEPKPFLPTGNKPPMQNCCEEILDYLADFEEAFDIKRLLKDKFPVSNTFMAPECDPASVTQAKSYYEIMQCVFRTMAHGMIFEPRVEIKDADAANAGDQGFKAKYINATGWASAVSEALMEVKDDGNVATNMDIRSGFAVTQLMVGVADAIYKLDTLLDCFGFELAHDEQTVETPYNLMIKLGKGFGKGNERQIDLNQDEATESLLPQLLQTKKNKIKTVILHPRSRTVHDILENIEASIGRISNG